jgi:hypothetical protein
MLRIPRGAPILLGLRLPSLAVPVVRWKGSTFKLTRSALFTLPLQLLLVILNLTKNFLFILVFFFHP